MKHADRNNLSYFLWSILDARSVSMPRWRHQSKKNWSLSVKERPKLKQLLKKRMNETLLWWRNIFSLFYNFVLFTLNIFLNANYIKRMKHEKLLPEWESGVGGGWNGRGCGLQENETGIGSHAQIFTASRKKSKQTSSSKDSSPHIDFPISLPSHFFSSNWKIFSSILCHRFFPSSQSQLNVHTVDNAPNSSSWVRLPFSMTNFGHTRCLLEASLIFHLRFKIGAESFGRKNFSSKVGIFYFLISFEHRLLSATCGAGKTERTTTFRKTFFPLISIFEDQLDQPYSWSVWVSPSGCCCCCCWSGSGCCCCCCSTSTWSACRRGWVTSPLRCSLLLGVCCRCTTALQNI